MEDAELLMMSVRLLTRPARRIALATLLLSGLAAVRPGHAAPQVVVDAEDLDLSVPCLGRFEITVDPAMSDGVSIDSSATGGAHLTMRTAKTQGSSKVLITSKSCAPAAKVAILVAPSVGVLIHDSHDTHFVINGTLASLEASLEAGQLDADTVQSLDLSLRGTEQVHIAHLNRAAQVVETGASGSWSIMPVSTPFRPSFPKPAISPLPTGVSMCSPSWSRMLQASVWAARSTRQLFQPAARGSWPFRMLAAP